MKETWVIKIGSSLVTRSTTGLNIKNIKSWASQINEIRKKNINVIIVSSGAIAEGIGRLGLIRRPTSSSKLQALAAIGQMGLVQAYEVAFKKYNILTAQMLLTHEDLSNRERYLNAKNTLNNLTKYNVIPIINENDTVSTDEIKFGDNDTLAALVSNLSEAKLLVILTDQDGLHTSDPKNDNSSKLVTKISVSDKNLNKSLMQDYLKLNKLPFLETTGLKLVDSVNHKLSHQNLKINFWINYVEKLNDSSIYLGELSNFPFPKPLSSFIETFNKFLK